MAQLAQHDVRISCDGPCLLLAIFLAMAACDSEPPQDQWSVPPTAGAGSNLEPSEGTTSTGDAPEGAAGESDTGNGTAGSGQTPTPEMVSGGGSSEGDASGTTSEPATPDAHCERTDQPWVPPASEVGRISCSAGISITSTHHRGRGWALVSPPPPDFAALHAFGGAPTLEFDLAGEVSRGLLPSPGELPAVLHAEATTDGQILELYRGLPTSLTAERLVSETRTLSIASGNGRSTSNP